jgi:NADPH:quinone reductase-like Zn-dependent oxidoreductase
MTSTRKTMGRTASENSGVMKAMLRDSYGSPDVLRLQEVTIPVPEEGEVLVKVHASSVNTTDVEHLRGLPRITRLGTGSRKPRTDRVGSDVVGQVEVVGQKVTSLVPGDQVWADLFGFGHGAFAEYVCAPETAFASLPAEVTFDEAATVPHSAVLALQGVRAKGQVEPGQNVLINGAGGCVGPFAVQIAKSFGAKVTAVDHAEKLEMMRSAGADHVVDYTKEDFTDNGQRYDLILDIAAQRSILHYRRSLAPRGSYVRVGGSVSGFVMALLIGAWISLIGTKRMGVFMWRPNNKDDLEFLKGLLETGRIVPIMGRRFTLREVPEAIKYVEDGHSRGNVVITP